MGVTEHDDAGRLNWFREKGHLTSSNEGFVMLVLTRRAGESIMIDDEIELKVLKIRGSQVHLGIDAPKRAAVHRKEVWLRIQEEVTPPPTQTATK
jgi:carbon storage regulator